MSNDVMKFDIALIFINYVYLAPIGCAASLYFLWPTYGYACLGGFSILIFLAILQSFQSRLFLHIRMKTAGRSDKRIKIIDEMINSMKAIKVLISWLSSGLIIFRCIAGRNISKD